LDGLEATEIRLSKILSGAVTFRLDSEYYQKQFLADEALITTRAEEFEKFHALGLEVDGSAFYPALEPHYGLGDFPFLRVADVKGYVDFNNCMRIPKEILPNFPTLKVVNAGDIVLTKGGSIARAGLITEEGAASRDLIFINSSKLDEVEYVYLSTYFQTDLCNRLLVRSSSLSVQPHLTLTLVRDLDIFKASSEFKEKLLGLIKVSRQKLEQSKTLYAQAESLLLDELGLKDWQPSGEKVAVKSFAESFGKTGRLDAEHYQPKYEELMQLIRQSKYEQRALQSLTEPILNGAEFREFTDEGTPYIRVGDIKKGRVDIENAKKISATEKDLKKNIALKLGDILFTRKGSFGNAAVVGAKELGSIISSEIMLLRLRGNLGVPILPDYLCAYLNSKLGYLQVERFVHGVAFYSITQPDLAQVEIVIAPLTTQQKIVSKVQESRIVETKSKELLHVAKRGVEMAIERDEAGALAWMESAARDES